MHNQLQFLVLARKICYEFDMLIDDRYVEVAFIALKLDENSGHLKWSVTQLAKKAKISRSWIYKVFGSSKKEILESSLYFVLEDVFCASSVRRKNMIESEDGLAEGYLLTRQSFRRYPEALQFYYKHADSKNSFGEMIAKYEKIYRQILSKITGVEEGPKLGHLRSELHGIVTSSFMTDQEALVAFKKIFSKQKRLEEALCPS